MIFIDLEKAHDRIPKEIMSWILKNKGFPLKYVRVIKDMHDVALANVITSGYLRIDFLAQ